MFLTNEDNELWERASNLIVRSTTTMSKNPDQYVDGLYPKFLEYAKGAYVYDRNGNKFLDFACAIGPIILGYNHTNTNEAIKNQLEKGIIFTLPTILEQELASLIVETVPCAQQVKFGKNGSDATTAAIRCARSYTGRNHVAFCGYHGWGDFFASAGERNYGIPLQLKEFMHEFYYNDCNSLEKILSEHDVAAVIMEPQALTVPNEGFLENVKKLSNKRGAVLIFDEIVTGYRWSLSGAQGHYSVIPDLCTLGKASANGMPISILAGKKEIMSEFEHVFFSGTFFGECLTLAAAISTINELKNKDYSHIWNLGNMLNKGINETAKNNDLQVDFMGSAPRQHLKFKFYNDLDGMKDLFFQEMCKQNILWSNVIYIQFSHTKEDIQRTIEAADKAFKFVSENRDNVDKVLLGKRSRKIFRKNS